MKSKISITLSESVLDAIDRSGGHESRSAFIEGVLEEYFRRVEREAIHTHDLASLNREAEGLNSEAGEVLEYRAWPE